MYNIVIDNNQNCGRIYWTELEISVVGKTKPGSCRHMISGYNITGFKVNKVSTGLNFCEQTGIGVFPREQSLSVLL